MAVPPEAAPPPPAPEPGPQPGPVPGTALVPVGRPVRSARRRRRDALVTLLTRLHLRRHAVAVRRMWRRSLMVRVVAATVALGLVVVLATGQFLYGRIATGLVESRRAAAERETLRLAQEAQTQLDQAGNTITDSASAASAIGSVVSALQGPVDDSDRAVLIRKARTNTVEDAPFGRAAGGLSEPDVPPLLSQQVDADPSTQHSQLVRITPGNGPPQSVVLVGQVLEIPVVGRYELYVAYRLDREEALLDVVRRTFIVGGFALVVLVAGVAYVVTRWVVTPVRQAARTAEQLASGRLDRRMRVRGEDDLARLGRAFNEMATSLERQIHRLEELSRVQRLFVSDVSHELRTPLTTIRMAGEVIHEARGSFEPALARSAELLQDQLDRFEALLADLLEISRFDAGAAVLEAEQADVRDVAARVVDGLRPLAERRGSALRLLVPDAACLAEIDARRVERVLRNLLGNALEHGEGRPVDVRVASDATAVAVGVRDRGAGLEPEQLPQVFNRFWRGDPARARTTGGTGLGLAISLEDAHLHAGRLEAWGLPGLGAHFVLTLPRTTGDVLGDGPLPLDPRLLPDDTRPHDAGPHGGPDGAPRDAGRDAGPRDGRPLQLAPAPGTDVP